MSSLTLEHKSAVLVRNNFNLPRKRRLAVQSVYYQLCSRAWQSEMTLDYSNQARYTIGYDLPLYEESQTTLIYETGHTETSVKI